MGRSRRIGRIAAVTFTPLLALAFALAPALPAAGHAAPATPAGKAEPMMLPEDSTASHTPQGLPGDAYVAEVVDSTFFVGPAEFFALDLPTVSPGVQATHLLGTVSATGKGDIIVRLFSGVEYDRWLKKRGGPEAKPFWVSAKARTINIENELPPGQPVVLLLDNGYSIRTPKRVHCQLQIEYRHIGAAGGSRPPGGAATITPKTPVAGDDVVPTPRSNDEEDSPPPPPPPPPDESAK